MAAPLGLYHQLLYFYNPSVFSQGMAFCYCGRWLSKSRTLEMNHSLERSHLKAKMCDYQTGPINPLNNTLSLLCIPIPLMPGPLLASRHTWHSELQSEL